MKPRLVAPVIGVVIMLLSVVEPVDAQAVHAHRATRRRTAVVVSHVVREDEQQKAAAASAQSTAEQQSATAAQQSATAAQQSATAQQQTAVAQQQAAAPATAGSAPIGTVASALPAGCVTSVVGGAQYYHCGNDWYRGAFQGDNLVYMTTAPPQ